jgi:hypothetical protein
VRAVFEVVPRADQFATVAGEDAAPREGAVHPLFADDLCARLLDVAELAPAAQAWRPVSVIESSASRTMLWVGC